MPVDDEDGGGLLDSNEHGDPGKEGIGKKQDRRNRINDMHDTWDEAMMKQTS